MGLEEGEINFRFQNNSQCGSDFVAPPPPRRRIKSSHPLCARVGKWHVDHREGDSDGKPSALGISTVELTSRQEPHEGPGDRRLFNNGKIWRSLAEGSKLKREADPGEIISIPSYWPLT